MTKGHSERAHSKFSASGAERWFACPGSVELSEGLPSKSSPWAKEGTQAHEVLELLMTGVPQDAATSATTPEMLVYGMEAANFIMKLGRKLQSEVIIESRVRLDFIHPEMFGTYDGAAVDHFGTLHVFDYKYGAGHAVSPKENLQMIFYGLGLAHKYDWNFHTVRLWIIQPRIKGYDGPLFWELSIQELRKWVPKFEQAVKRVLTSPEEFNEGQWCHWCRAKSICPKKRAAKLEEAKQSFSIIPIQKGNK